MAVYLSCECLFDSSRSINVILRHGLSHVFCLIRNACLFWGVFPGVLIREVYLWGGSVLVLGGAGMSRAKVSAVSLHDETPIDALMFSRLMQVSSMVVLSSRFPFLTIPMVRDSMSTLVLALASLLDVFGWSRRVSQLYVFPMRLSYDK